MNNIEFERASAQYLTAKNLMDSSFIALLASAPSFSQSILNQSFLSGTYYFTQFEQYLVSLSGANEYLTKSQLEDVLTSVENVLEFSLGFWESHRAVFQRLNLPMPMASSNHLTTAQSVLKTYRKNRCDVLKEKYIQCNLPVEGFDMKRNVKLVESSIDWVSIIIGGTLLMLSLFIVFWLDVKTGMQYWVTRMSAALGVGLLLSGATKSYVKAHIRMNGITITALGAAATFFILYLVNPADPPKFENTKTEIIDKK